MYSDIYIFLIQCEGLFEKKFTFNLCAINDNNY